MTEHDTDLSRRLEAALLDQLARKDERICMLEAQLEETRRKSEPTEHEPRVGFETPPAPAPVRARAYRAKSPAANVAGEPLLAPAPLPAAERKPIVLPEFGGAHVDAIADVVREKASIKARQTAPPDNSRPAVEAQIPFVSGTRATAYASPDFEPTARWNAQALRRGNQEERASPIRSRFPIQRAGVLAVLSLAIAALCVSFWQHRQSALVSESVPALSSLPLVKPPQTPLPAPKSPSAAMPIVGATPVVEPVSEPSGASHSPQRTVSAASQPQERVPPRAAGMGHAHHAAQTRSAAVAGSALPTSHRRTPAAFHARKPDRETNSHSVARLMPQPPALQQERTAGSDTDHSETVLSSAPAPYRRRPRAARVASQADFAPHSRRRIASASVGNQPRTAGGEAPRHDTQGNVHRAMRTLDEMQELLDSIERRKHHSAESNSE